MDDFGGRLLGRGGVDPAWARIDLDDGREVLVSEARIAGLADD